MFIISSLMLLLFTTTLGVDNNCLNTYIQSIQFELDRFDHHHTNNIFSQYNRYCTDNSPGHDELYNLTAKLYDTLGKSVSEALNRTVATKNEPTSHAVVEDLNLLTYIYANPMTVLIEKDCGNIYLQDQLYFIDTLDKYYLKELYRQNNVAIPTTDAVAAVILCFDLPNVDDIALFTLIRIHLSRVREGLNHWKKVSI